MLNDAEKSMLAHLEWAMKDYLRGFGKDMPDAERFSSFQQLRTVVEHKGRSDDLLSTIWEMVCHRGYRPFLMLNYPGHKKAVDLPASAAFVECSSPIGEPAQCLGRYLFSKDPVPCTAQLDGLPLCRTGLEYAMHLERLNIPYYVRCLKKEDERQARKRANVLSFKRDVNKLARATEWF